MPIRSLGRSLSIIEYLNKHKELKGLKRENLRDHMTHLELIFSMLGEASTTQITKIEHPPNSV